MSLKATTFSDSKAHYALLDGLRGVAALFVVWYHVFEGFGFAQSVNGVGDGLITSFNHGYLAVDFFFILSGFVIGYAYDDRWAKGFTMGQFFKRRLIRLHPMVIVGALIGIVTFCLQGAVKWDGTHVATSAIMLSLLCAMFMIPAVPGTAPEIRGNGEMYPLNGPEWSLFFEYVGNIIYALLLRRLSTKVLGCIAAVLGATLLWFNACNVSGLGMFGVGWTLDGMNFAGGLLRMMFPYTMGMFMARIFRPAKVHGAFWLCSAVLLALFAVPYLPAMQPLCMNGVFESVCIIAVFPILVWLAASGQTTDAKSTSVCTFLGNISFPLYIIHYPFMYMFYAWLIEHHIYTLGECWPVALALMAWNVAVAYVCLKFYDLPVRNWLSSKYSRRS